MRLVKNTRPTRIIFASALIAVVLLAVILAYSFNFWPFSNRSPVETVSSTSSSSLDQNDTEKEEPTTSNNPVDSTSNSVKSQITNPESTSTDQKLTITSVQDNSGSLRIRTAIQEVTSSGECTLNVKNSSNNKTYSETVGVQALASNSTCKGFNVPISELSSGTWEITVTYMLNGVEKAKDSVQEVVNA